MKAPERQTNSHGKAQLKLFWIKMKNLEFTLIRRAEFLLAEARSKNPKRDQAVTYAMRAISNYCTIGTDQKSATLKKRNKNISEAAQILRTELSEQDWYTATRNDHQDPLHEVWNWILKKADKLTAPQIIARFRKYPMVTITKAEDKKLTTLGYRHKGKANIRYKAAKIKKIPLN